MATANAVAEPHREHMRTDRIHAKSSGKISDLELASRIANSHRASSESALRRGTSFKTKPRVEGDDEDVKSVRMAVRRKVKRTKSASRAKSPTRGDEFKLGHPTRKKFGW